MARHCRYCEHEEVEKHRNFKGEEQWSCERCGRVYEENEDGKLVLVKTHG